MNFDVMAFNVTIFEDALTLLLSDKTDIRQEILEQLQQGDYCLERLEDDLYDLCEEYVLDADKVINRYKDMSCEDLMKYIYFSEAGIAFDYSESVECGDRRMCAFDIMCTFDVNKFLKDIEAI